MAPRAATDLFTAGERLAAVLSDIVFQIHITRWSQALGDGSSDAAGPDPGIAASLPRFSVGTSGAAHPPLRGEPRLGGVLLWGRTALRQSPRRVQGDGRRRGGLQPHTLPALPRDSRTGGDARHLLWTSIPILGLIKGLTRARSRRESQWSRRPRQAVSLESARHVVFCGREKKQMGDCSPMAS